MEKLLFINACVREKESRTMALCNLFLEKYKNANKDVEIIKVDLANEDIKPLNSKLLNQREVLINKKDFNNPIFKQANLLLQADKIVIGAPFWDFSFPSILRVYFEDIFVNTLTFTFDEKGEAKSHIKCQKLFFISTVGGYIENDNIAKQYMQSFCKLFDIKESFFHFAQGLDIVTNDVDSIVKTSFEQLENKVQEFL